MTLFDLKDASKLATPAFTTTMFISVKPVMEPLKSR